MMGPTMDCTVLERPGRWRAAATIAILSLAVLPAVPLLGRSLAGVTDGASFAGPGFLNALGGSLAVAGAVAAIAYAVGLPAGVLAALYEFPGRRLLLGLSTLPLIAPSFLWAIGWSKLAAWIGPRAPEALSSLGPHLVFGALTVPLVLWASFAATSALTRSQIDAARLAGGEKAVLSNAARQAAVPALLAAVLGGVLTLSDAGPDQIFGSNRVASQILVSFSALHDYELAGRQCVLLAGAVLALALPISVLAAPRVAAASLPRQVEGPVRSRVRTAAVAGEAFFLAMTLLGTALPLLGLALPLLDETGFDRAFAIAERTLGDTLVYAGVGGTVAVVLGFTTAAAVGREHRLRKFAIAFSIAAFSLPPSLAALGVIRLATQAPAGMDFLLRSKATVCLGHGLRLLPVAFFLGLRSWAGMPPSWALAAAVHGVPPATYIVRVVLPHLAPAGIAAFLLVALLSAADLTTVLLLHPPGASSLSLSVFTVMANARESLVASLCLIYFAFALTALVFGWAATRVVSPTRKEGTPPPKERPAR